MIVQLLSHMYFYTERKTPSGRAEEGGAGRGGAGGGVNLFKQQNHGWRVKNQKARARSIGLGRSRVTKHS